MSDSLIVAYTPEYQQKCFAVWYSSGRPKKASQILEVIPVDEHGRKPHKSVILKWKDELGWDLRADELDAKAEQISDDLLVQQKVKMLAEQAERGLRLQQLGMEYLESADMKKGFDSASAAVQAVIRGAELERSSRGISEMFAKLVKMDDRELSSTIVGLLIRAKDNEQVIDADEVHQEEEQEEKE